MNVQMNVDPIVFIKETAKAIQERKIKPYVIIENPHKILSGETKKILINKRGVGIQVGEEIVDLMIKYGSKIKKDELEWETFCNIPDNNMKSAFVPRDDPVLIKMVERKIRNDLNFKIAEVPIEPWAWYISKSGQAPVFEFVAMTF
jgi:hypothetical protein